MRIYYFDVKANIFNDNLSPTPNLMYCKYWRKKSEINIYGENKDGSTFSSFSFSNIRSLKYWNEIGYFVFRTNFT